MSPEETGSPRGKWIRHPPPAGPPPSPSLITVMTGTPSGKDDSQLEHNRNIVKNNMQIFRIVWNSNSQRPSFQTRALSPRTARASRGIWNPAVPDPSRPSPPQRGSISRSPLRGSLGWNDGGGMKHRRRMNIIRTSRACSREPARISMVGKERGAGSGIEIRPDAPNLLNHPSPPTRLRGEDNTYGPVFTCMLSSLIISDDVSTASKAEAGICFSWFSRPSGQRLSEVPWKYQGVPLSARTRP